MKRSLPLLCGALLLCGQLSGGGEIAARRAFRKAAEEAGYSEQFLVSRLHDPDPEIARHAVTLLAAHHRAAARREFEKFSGKIHPLVAEAMLIALKESPQEESAELQRRIIASCGDPRLAAYGRVKLPYRLNLSLRHDPSYDHAVTVIRKLELPRDGWKFVTDPGDDGVGRKFFAADFDDSSWKTLSVDRSWEEQGFPGYDGIGWYRMKFRMPEKPECVGVDIVFGAVDESTWVWLNGKFVGQHDIGPAGWNTTFFLNIASEVRWGGENILTVRVKDTAAAGGIWKPVSIEVLK